MRIAYLTQPYPPMISGASIFAEQMAKGMANRGHEVLVIAASDREYAYTQIEEDITIVRLRSINNPLRIGQRLLLAPRNMVMKTLQEFQPDVIHVHEPIQMGTFGLEHAKQHGIPITLTTHQLPWFIASYLPDKFFIREIAEAMIWLYSGWLMKRFSSVIAPTKTISKIIKHKTGVKTKTIHYGIDLETFHPHTSLKERKAARSRFGLPPNAPIILHTGRLDTDKSVHHVIHAAAESMKDSDAHLLVVGDGKQRDHLIHLCKSLGIEARAHFPGFIVDKEKLAEIYRMSNVFVTASEIETQGIVILEAAACRLPIVAVSATCIPEVVQHKGNGLLVNSGDINGMSSSITRILGDESAAQAMRSRSYDIAQKYGLRISISKHEKHYKQMLKQKVRDVVMIKAFSKTWEH